MRAQQQDLQDQVSVLQAELATEMEKRTFIDEQLQKANQELAQTQQPSDVGQTASGFGLFESAADLKEKNARLERELRALKSEGATSPGSADVQFLRDEMEHERSLRKERDEAYLETSKKVSELQREKAQLNQLLEERSRVAANSSESQIRHAETAVDVFQKRNIDLEQQIEAVEGERDKARHDKTKIEAFVRKALPDLQQKVRSIFSPYQFIA